MTTVTPNLNALGEVFAGDLVTLTDAANFASVTLIHAGGRQVTLHGKNGVGSVTDLRISSTSVRDGVMVPLATGSDLNAAVAGVVAIRPAYPACLAAGCDWELLLDCKAADVLVEAKGDGTTLRVSGMVV